MQNHLAERDEYALALLLRREARDRSVRGCDIDSAQGRADAAEDRLSGEGEFLSLLAIGESEHGQTVGQPLLFLGLIGIGDGEPDQDGIAGDGQSLG